MGDPNLGRSRKMSNFGSLLLINLLFKLQSPTSSAKVSTGLSEDVLRKIVSMFVQRGLFNLYFA